MVTKVYKYVLPLEDEVRVTEIPKGAEFLHIDSQDGKLCLWCRVNPEAPKDVFRLRIAGTGHSLKDDVGEHIGSCQMGPFVWHVFRLGVL